MPDGKVFCEHCGAVSDKLTALIEIKEDNLRDLERDMRTARAKITRLQRERDLDPKSSPLYPLALEAFHYWRERLMPKAREFNGDRMTKVLARLQGADTPQAGLELIKRAVDGVTRLPYVTNQGRQAEGRPSERQVELELICRSEDKLMRFASYANEIVEPLPSPAPQTTTLPQTVVRVNGWRPRNRRELIDAVRGRILLYEVEESPKKKAVLLAEIHEFTRQ